MAEGNRVITPDLRNHGQSPHAERMSYIIMANDVISVADHLNMEDIILVGHSIGGKVARTAAMMNPDRMSA